MKTTSLGLSKRIYAAFPEWVGTELNHWENTRPEGQISRDKAIFGYGTVDGLSATACPAYDTDYLLDKLPAGSAVDKTPSSDYEAIHYGKRLHAYANTPTEALGLLVMALHDEGVL